MQATSNVNKHRYSVPDHEYQEQSMPLIMNESFTTGIIHNYYNIIQASLRYYDTCVYILVTIITRYSDGSDAPRDWRKSKMLERVQNSNDQQLCIYDRYMGRSYAVSR